VPHLDWSKCVHTRIRRVMFEAELQRILRGTSVEKLLQEEVYADWVKTLAPWDTFFTNTFRWPCSENSGRRLFERFMRREQPRVPVFYGIDPNPNMDGGHHVHALLASSGGAHRRSLWRAWYELYGVNQVVPVEHIGGVSGYVAKYPLGGARWWNVLNCRQCVFG